MKIKVVLMKSCLHFFPDVIINTSVNLISLPRTHFLVARPTLLGQFFKFADICQWSSRFQGDIPNEAAQASICRVGFMSGPMLNGFVMTRFCGRLGWLASIQIHAFALPLFASTLIACTDLLFAIAAFLPQK